MEIIFKGRHTGVPERFRSQASTKLAKLGRLNRKLIRIDVEVSKERNPRQADRKERVELTIRHPGPVIRAEAAADDRYTALDLALAKIESRLRRVNDRRVGRGVDAATRLRTAAVPGRPWPGARGRLLAAAAARLGAVKAAGPAVRAADAAPGFADAAPGFADDAAPGFADAAPGFAADAEPGDDRFVPIEMDGEGPLVVREKFHPAGPMSIDQALLQMELVGHDFFLFRDSGCGQASVVYRRRGYDYGVIRLVEV